MPEFFESEGRRPPVGLLRLFQVDGGHRIGIPRDPKQRSLSAGHMNDRTAERMKISEPVVRLHLINARRKFKAPTREQALVKALKLGLLSV